MRLLGTTLACAVLASLALLPGNARGQQPEKEEGLGKALETILTRLKRENKGLYLGITEQMARKRTPGAADLAGDRILALQETQYAPEGVWKGTVRVFLSGEPGEKVDSIQVCLLCGEYDEARMVRKLIGIGKKLGFDFEVDDEAPNTWWDPADHKRDLWISFGKGLIAVDADLMD